ncbi:MAG: hypothetical protein J6Q30_02275 [Oscillospiraceae bacterium]|nr:hypothetical protein [Oscillospiraceae bacterium]
MERIMLWLLALIASIFGMARIMTPKVETGPVFKPAQTEQSAGALPEFVPGTELCVQALVQYEGAFWEDGTGEYVSNVAALMLYNPSDTGIAYGEVFLTLQDQEYTFEFTYLPAGGRLLVPEKNRLPYVRGKVTDCRCGELVTRDFGTEDSGITLTPKGLAGIVLENTTQSDFKNVKLSYKLYLQDHDAYVGGSTYEITVESLPAGESQEIVPPKFVWGYSKVLDIQTGEQ